MNIDALMAADRETLLSVDDIGEVIADSIIDYFSDPGHREEIERLKAAGLEFSLEEKSGPKSEVLKDNIIVISGNFSVSRDEIKELISQHGGKNSSSVSGKTTYLLAGEKPGPEKLKKAESLGIPVIDEAEFRRMIEGNTESPAADAGPSHEKADAGPSREKTEAGPSNEDIAGSGSAAPVQLTLF